MPEYCSSDDVQNRLTPLGVAWVAERDQSGTGVTDDDQASYITPAIQFAGAIIDQHVQNRTTITNARASGNQWLNDRCVDLAVERALQIGGRDVPDSIADASAKSLQLLERHAAGQLDLPGYNYEYPHFGPGVTTRGVRWSPTRNYNPLRGRHR